MRPDSQGVTAPPPWAAVYAPPPGTRFENGDVTKVEERARGPRETDNRTPNTGNQPHKPHWH